MGIQRKLPGSDVTRDRALIKAKAKNDSLAAPDRFLTTPTQNRLNAIQPLLRSHMLARSVALANQADSTSTVELNKIAAKMVTAHFISAFDNGIKRNVFVPAHRAHYALPVGNDTLPRLVTEEEILQVGDQIIAGDVTRLAAGGAAMSNPSPAEVGVAITNFRTNNNAQSNLKDAFDDAQQRVEDDRPEADAVIKKVWDEVETHFNEETITSKRRKAREWGVIYVSDVKLKFTFHVNDSANGNAIENVLGQLIETENEKLSDATGLLVIESTITGQATFRFTHADYVDQEIVIDLPDGELLFEQDVMLVHV